MMKDDGQGTSHFELLWSNYFKLLIPTALELITLQLFNFKMNPEYFLINYTNFKNSRILKNLSLNEP